MTHRTGNRYVPAATENLAYDEDGNLVSDGRWVYNWDGENRLIAMETTSAAITAGVPKRKLEFAYDGGSRRIQKQVYDWNAGTSSWTLNSERRFVYDQWNMVAEVNAEGDLIKSHVWGMDISQSMQGAGGVGGLLWSVNTEVGASDFVAYDGNGNVMVLVKVEDGSLTGRYDFNAFGQTVLTEGLNAKSNAYRFSTKYGDAETELYYYGFRYYQPATGRWLNRDPIGEEGGINVYHFVFNSPTVYLDLLGLDVLSSRVPCPCKAEDVNKVGYEYAKKALAKSIDDMKNIPVGADTSSTGREAGGIICCNTKTALVKASDPILAAGWATIRVDGKIRYEGASFQMSSLSPCKSLGNDFVEAGSYHSHPGARSYPSGQDIKSMLIDHGLKGALTGLPHFIAGRYVTETPEVTRTDPTTMPPLPNKYGSSKAGGGLVVPINPDGSEGAPLVRVYINGNIIPP